MKTRPFVLLGIGAIAAALVATPLSARAGDGEEALAFVAGAVVGHVLSRQDDDYRPAHWRHRHEPVRRHHRSHHCIERAHHHKHAHRGRERRHDRWDHRWDDRRDHRDRHRGHGWS